jgi:hypothetical protein
MSNRFLALGIAIGAGVGRDGRSSGRSRLESEEVEELREPRELA